MSTLSVMTQVSDRSLFADRVLLRWAIVGDVVVLTIITIIGFATHHTLDAYWRMFITVLVTLIAWAVVAPWFDAFSTTTLTRPLSVWKILLATVVATPLAAFLRGWFLGIEVSSTFILTGIALNGLAMVIWRAALAASAARASRQRTAHS
jgi:cellulose synthase/poly-beta-1,6-N-acetylglucosamine synthase-like glycosyltransferase